MDVAIPIKIERSFRGLIITQLFAGDGRIEHGLPMQQVARRDQTKMAFTATIIDAIAGVNAHVGCVIVYLHVPEASLLSLDDLGSGPILALFSDGVDVLRFVMEESLSMAHEKEVKLPSKLEEMRVAHVLSHTQNMLQVPVFGIG